MKIKQLLWVPLLAAPALFAFTGAPSKVMFAPSEGSSVVKKFDSVVELNLDSMSMSMNGQDSPVMPDMEMNLNMKRTVSVTVQYVKVRDNTPGTLRRTFDTLENSVNVHVQVEMMGQSQTQDHDIPAASELEGKTVVFTWNEDQGAFSKAFDPPEENDELLEDLFEDMDLRALLPTGEVEEGAEWKIEMKNLATVLAPGGNLALVPEEMDGEQMMSGMGMGGDISDWLSELLEGEATGKFLGVREADGQKLAAIKVSFDVDSSNDMTDRVVEMMAELDLPPEMKNMDFDHIDIDFSLEGEGELLWNLDAGRAHSFELSGPTRMTYDIGLSMEVPGQGGMSIEQTLEMSGTMSLSAAFE